MEALQEPGCPICWLAAAASKRWLQALFHEYINDAGVRLRLRSSGGFCSRHTRQMLGIGDPLGGSILYADVLRDSLDAPVASEEPTCLLCEYEARTALAALETLLEHIPEDDVQSAYDQSDGICWPHLRLATTGGRHRRGHLRVSSTRDSGDPADLLLALERQKMMALVEECEGFVAKSDYRHSGRVTPGEGNAWRRAAWKLGGGHADRQA
jgi:hypothetical protein